MKLCLLLLTLLTCACILHAQAVLVKDSVTDNFREAFHLPASVTLYEYDSACRLVKAQSPGSQNFFMYYPNSNHLYQVVSTIYQGNALTGEWIWRTSDRRTYTYNDNGNVTGLEYGYWDTLTGTFPPAYGDTFLYNGDVKTKSFYRHWDKASLVWVTDVDTSFYYNSLGQLDSLIAISHPYEQKTALRLTYYPSGKLYKTTGYLYDEDNPTGTYHYYDSSGNVSTDSIVTYSRSFSGDSLMVSDISTVTTYYDENNRKSEIIYRAIFNYLLSDFKYSKVFLTYGTCQPAFPVTYLSFSAIRQSNNSVLSWQTANETNTSSFRIQRSTDGVHFTTIGSVIASGNSSRHAYTFTDANALLMNASGLYYRVAEEDNNGTLNYSKTVTLDVAAGKPIAYVAPNPVAGSINLYIPATAGAAQITVSDMKGNIVYSGKQNIVGGNEVTINASGFAKGMYIVTIQSVSSKQQIKIVKE